MNGLRKEVYAKFINQDLEFFDENKSGELVSRLTHDCGQLKGACTEQLSSLLACLV